MANLVETTTQQTNNSVQDELVKIAQEQFGQITNVNIKPINLSNSGNFPFNYELSSDISLFNELTYNWISHNLKLNTNNTLEFDGVFTNLYYDAISSISYVLSDSDNAILTEAETKAQVQGRELQDSWISNMGELPETNPKETTLNAIVRIIQNEWCSKSQKPTLNEIRQSKNLYKLLDKTPPSGDGVFPAFVKFLNAKSSVLPLLDAVSLKTGRLQALKDSIDEPTEENGGLKVANPQKSSKQTIKPSFSISKELSLIVNELNNSGQKIDISFEINKSSEEDFSINVSGGTNFKIPVLSSLISLGVNAKADYLKDAISKSDNGCKVEMVYPGVTYVPFDIKKYDLSSNTGWFDAEPIRDAISNTKNDISSYKFLTDKEKDYSANGPFRLLGGVLISNYPTVKITIRSSEYQSLAEQLKQSAEVNLKVFGVTVASGKEATEWKKVETDESKNSVTITITPPLATVAGNINERRAWVIAGTENYPL